MVWTDICSWASCSAKEDEKPDQIFPVRSSSRTMSREMLVKVSEKRIRTPEKTKRPPPPPPSVISEPPKIHPRMERDLPPIPPIPASIYEMGVHSPRTGLTRANSRGSMRTMASTRSRNRRTEYDKHASLSGTPDRHSRKESDSNLEGVAYVGSLEESGRGQPRDKATPRPLVLSIHEAGGQLLELPKFSARPSPTRSKTWDHTPVSSGNEYDDSEQEVSPKVLYRRSDTAPIPVYTPLLRSLQHSIRRKPISPESSISHSRPATASSLIRETPIDEAYMEDVPIELYVPAFELSAYPKSRTQSFYADAGTALLAATLDEAPPMPDLAVVLNNLPTVSNNSSTETPDLRIDTSGERRFSAVDTPNTKKHLFTPLTTFSSPVDKPDISPITPHSSRARDRLTLLKRSKSVGQATARSRQSTALKRRSFEAEAPPLPVLPAMSCIPSSQTSTKLSVPDTLSTEADDISRRTSATSNSSAPAATPPSSNPGIMRSSTYGKKRQSMVARITRPKEYLDMLKPTILNRRSMVLPSSASRRDPKVATVLPSLPPLPTSHLHTLPNIPNPQPILKAPEQDPSKSKPAPKPRLTRSSSTENLAPRSATSTRLSMGVGMGRSVKALTSLRRSKSTYNPSTVSRELNQFDSIVPRGSQMKASAASMSAPVSLLLPPSVESLPPLPTPVSEELRQLFETGDVDVDGDGDGYSDRDGLVGGIGINAIEDHHVTSAERAVEDLPEIQVQIPAETVVEVQDKSQSAPIEHSTWGRGIGAEWGVAY